MAEPLDVALSDVCACRARTFYLLSQNDATIAKQLFAKYAVGDGVGTVNIEFVPNIIRRFGHNPTNAQLAEFTEMYVIILY